MSSERGGLQQPGGDRKLSHGTCFLQAGGQWLRVLCCFLFRPALGEGSLEAGSSSLPLAGSVAFRPFPVELSSFQAAL